MVTTYTWRAADRPSRGHWSNRREVEGALLLLATCVVTVGFAIAQLAWGASLRDFDRGVAAGRIVDLSGAPDVERLVPLLDFLPDLDQRRFAASEISRHVAHNRLRNVEELSKLEVGTEALADAGLLAGRVEAGGTERLRLLTLAEIRHLKPFLVVRSPREVRRSFWTWAGSLLLGFASVHVLWRFRGFRGDQRLLPILAVLTAIGTTSMFSIWDPLRDSLHYVVFAQGVLLGLAVLAAIALVAFERPLWKRLGAPALALALLLSLLVFLFGSGPTGSDARVNLFGAQPVEAIKLLLVFFLAAHFGERWEMLRELSERRGWFSVLASRVRVPRLEYFLPPVLAMFLFLAFFFMQRDLGPALIMSILFSTLYAVARGRSTMPVLGLSVLIAGFVVGYRLGTPHTVARRIDMWLSPWDSAFAGGDHLAQSLWSLASGGIAGTGFVAGQPGYVPAAHTDMVLAALGEELGFAGLLAVAGLYGTLAAIGLRIARGAGGAFSHFLALGATLSIVVPAILIAGGVSGVLPLAGIATPFLSHGRSAMVSSFAAVGLLLAVSNQVPDPQVRAAFGRATRRLGLVVLAASGLLICRFAYLQVLRADTVAARPAVALFGDGVRRLRYNPRLLDLAASIPRGTIIDRNGIPLAIAARVDLTPTQRQRLRALDADLDRVAGRERHYPFAGTTYHLLGDVNSFVGWAAANTWFVEREWQVRLQGFDDRPREIAIPQPNGEISTGEVRDLSELVPLLRHRDRPGHADVRRLLDRPRDVRLSLDVRLQLGIVELLTSGAGANERRGAVVVLDAASGDLLASVSVPQPRAQPVAMSEGERRLLDRSRFGLYPPGSTFKIVTAMAALRQDPALAEARFSCTRLSGGRVGNRVRGWGQPVRDDSSVELPHGEIALADAIRVSCNAYFAQLATYEIGARGLLATARELGIAVARPNTPEQVADALPQAAFGQGQVSATPLDMARIAAVVANGGLAVPGRLSLDTPQVPPVRVLPETEAGLIARAMRQVVLSGSARRLRSVLPPLAGKTGTAEVAGAPSHSWFIGFAPAAGSGRRIAFALVVENAGYGGGVAAEIAGELVRLLHELGSLEEGTPYG